VVFISTNTEATPMGINLTTLPYLGMIALAAGALALYIAMLSRRRKSAER
jgi:hypothetical protein